jgi:hypothetical protein
MGITFPVGNSPVVSITATFYILKNQEKTFLCITVELVPKPIVLKQACNIHYTLLGSFQRLKLQN